MKKILRCVTADNHNKEYIMETTNGHLQVQYGRVGHPYQTHMYGADQWDRILSAKLAKGYIDVTDNYEESEALPTLDTGSDFCNRMISRILDWSHQFLKKNVSIFSLNPEVINDARGRLAAMCSIADVRQFNRELISLFTVIPRSMRDVSSMLAKSNQDFSEILDRENDILDAVLANTKLGSNQESLKLPGYHFRECSDEELEMIENHLDPDTRSHFDTAIHVDMEQNRKEYEAYKKQHHITEEKILYHGSKNRNYWSIIQNGLMIHPTSSVTRSGAMFGNGLYFATKAKKSLGYSSLSGSFWASGHEANAALLLCKVAVGKSKHLNEFDPEVSTWNEAACRKAGYDSVFAHASDHPSLGSGRLYNDEIVVYNDHACTPAYVIFLKK